jgi:hypothetical protein
MNSILNSIDLPDGGRIVLYDWMGLKSGYSARNIENLVRLDVTGNMLWSAKLPQEGPADFFTDVRLEANKLIASTWSCGTVSVDIGTGIVTRVAFHK